MSLILRVSINRVAHKGHEEGELELRDEQPFGAKSLMTTRTPEGTPKSEPLEA